MQRIIKHATAEQPERRPTLPQILDAMRQQEALIPGVDTAVYDYLADGYFEDVRKWAKRSDLALLGRPRDFSVGSGPDGRVRRARDLFRQMKGADLAEAARMAREAAEIGYPPGMYLYATALRQGKGVPKNEEDRLMWIQRAVWKGDPRATYALGVHRLDHEKKEAEGLDLLKNAAKSDCPAISADAHHTIARYYEGKGDVANAKEWYFLASEKGSPAGCIDFARTLLEEKFGAIEYDEGLRRLEQAASKGSPEAMFMLGTLYREGKVFTKDLPKAADFLERAAEKNYVDAYYWLGVLYFPDDKGVSTVRPPGGQNPRDRAVDFYERAVAAGDLKAKHNYGTVLFHGKHGIHRDLARASRLWKEAADAGFAQSAYRFAECAENGFGMVRHGATANEYYRRATQGGYRGPKERLKSLMESSSS
jgi:TPR repeat protein